jgi:short chain dehydrogenase
VGWRYSGNPTITPLVRECASKDTLLIAVNPIERQGTPRSAREILDRLNEVSFNATPLKELRMLALLRQVADAGTGEGAQWARMRIHLIFSKVIDELGASSKFNAEWDFLSMLRDEGRRCAESFLKTQGENVGKRSTLDLDALLEDNWRVGALFRGRQGKSGSRLRLRDLRESRRLQGAPRDRSLQKIQSHYPGHGEVSQATGHGANRTQRKIQLKCASSAPALSRGARQPALWANDRGMSLMSLSFNNQLALVTGAASGMGLATARAFAEAGAAAALVDIEEDDVLQAAKVLVGTGHKAIGIHCNVADENEVAAAVERTVSELGRSRARGCGCRGRPVRSGQCYQVARASGRA